MGENSVTLVDEKFATFRTTFQKLAASTDSPFSLMCSLLLASGTEEDLKQLVSVSLDPLHYREGDEGRFAADYLMQKIASKLPDEFGSWNKLEPTLNQFCQQEDHCALINQQCITGEIIDRLAEIGVRIGDIKHHIKRVLGRAPTIEEICLNGGWGPGSTAVRSRARSVPEAKCADTSVTYRLARLLQDSGCHHSIPWWNQPWELVPGNTMFTVRKNAKTLRTASAEPAINGWFQKGIGHFMRARLRRIGIDLNDQTINQIMAMVAQVFRFATIDVKGASNSVACELIRLFFPPDWVALIDASRSERGTIDDRNQVDKTWFEYHMVSSMGNGFTFELESVLFYCLCRAAGCDSDDVWIYGDDIIVPQHQASKVVDVLQVCGFTVNTEKSFLNGLFFESCGVHVFNGCDVSPFYIKDILNEPEDVLRCANELRLFGTRLNRIGFPCRQYLSVYRYLVGRLPDAFKVRGPAGGGLCLFSNIEEFGRGRYVNSQLEYTHLLPKFSFNLQPEWAWTFEQFEAFYSDWFQGPVPRWSRSEARKRGFRRGVTRTSLKAKWRRVCKAGEGETPFLSQYRLFQLGNPLTGSHQWLKATDRPNSGNRVARVTHATWTKSELDNMSKHDRSRCGTLALKVVTGVTSPGAVVTLTNWSF